MLKKIYHELVAIRKELQAIRCSLESTEKSDPDVLRKAIKQANHLQEFTGQNPFFFLWSRRR